METNIYRGHSFSWFNGGSQGRYDDPPPDTPCKHCGRPYSEVGQNMHFCLGAWSTHRDRVAFVKALQGTE